MKLQEFVGLLLILALFCLCAPLGANECPPGHQNIDSCEDGGGDLGGSGDSIEGNFEQNQEQGQDQEQGQEQEQGQDQSQNQSQTAESTVISTFSGINESTNTNNNNNEANSTSNSDASSYSDSSSSSNSDASSNTSVSFSSPRRAPSTYLNLSNNTASCVRVLGFSFANTSGSGTLGMPLPRSKACDMWKAVQEAQENGHIALSYAFMCEIKNIRKVWGLQRCQEVTGQALSTLAELIEEPVEPILIAQVTQEEFVEQQQEVNDRFNQYEDLVETLIQEQDEKDEEIKRLKREAAVLREKQSKEAARRAKVREILKKEQDNEEGSND
jgi:hypothetical protein